MAPSERNRPATKPGDFTNVIAFHAGTDWSEHLHLDLNSHLIAHPSATFFLRVKGNSPDHSAIRDDDILIVDRALTPDPHNMVVAVINGGLVIAPYRVLRQRTKADSAAIAEETPSSAGADVWGVITYVIHKI